MGRNSPKIEPSLPVHEVNDFCKSQDYSDGTRLIGLILDGPYIGCLAGLCPDGTILPHKVGVVGANTYRNVTPMQCTVVPQTIQTNRGPIISKVMVQGKMQVKAEPDNRLDKVLEIMDANC